MDGRTVSHYKIISKLGEGGMGEVWEAHDSRLDRDVAIKLIPKHLSADPAARTRFVHEAKAASSIEHANICTIFEIDETPEGETFIVMPRYQGELLSDRITRGRPPLDEALHVVEDLAGALAEAHDHDIIHRDVKPANIIIDPHGRPVLLDFGLAKLTEHTKVTKTGTTVGTLAYMAPEQAVGKEVDGRADLFSLGVVFYELLTGVRPFRGDHDAAVLYAIAHEPAAPLASHDPSLPAALQEIVNCSLAKDPDERYASLHELQTAIRKLRQDLQIGSAAHMRNANRPPRSRWIFAIVVAAVALGAVAIWRFVPNRGVVNAAGQAVAVVDFDDLTGGDDPNLTVGMAGLIHVGMVENAPCRVVSPSYLQDIRRRLFGEEHGPIEEGQALEIARKSGATVLLAGQMGELNGERYVLWQLVDTESGESMAAKRAEGTRLSALADAVLEGVLPALAARCGAEKKPASTSVSSLTTAIRTPTSAM